MGSSTNKVVGYVGAAFVIAWFMCGAMLASILIDALVLKTLWGWFIVPHFGAAPLTVPIAGGLAAIACLLHGTGAGSKQSRHKDDDDDDKSDADAAKALRRNLEDLRASLLAIVVRPLAILAVGWILMVSM